jgi:SAM-dependent methyltransferase
MTDEQPRIYTDLADWFHLLTAPAEYAEEAEFYLRTIAEALGHRPLTLLELGAGGGNNAWHYKRTVERVTLTDLSPRMLALSERINPECEHIIGDMRSARLSRVFDAVFIHDAVGYLTTADDLQACVRTAFVHCRPGGVALFAPDHVREIFVVGTDHGGHDGDDGRALRYLEWTYDPDPADSTYLVDYAFLFHVPGRAPHAVNETHVCGLFSRAQWLGWLAEAGFASSVLPFEHSEVPAGTLEVFVGRKPTA